MLTAELAAVRRTVGELDFRLARKAFNRTCGSKSPHGWRRELQASLPRVSRNSACS